MQILVELQDVAEVRLLQLLRLAALVRPRVERGAAPVQARRACRIPRAVLFGLLPRGRLARIIAGNRNESKESSQRIQKYTSKKTGPRFGRRARSLAVAQVRGEPALDNVSTPNSQSLR